MVEGSTHRLYNRHDLVLFTDGESSCANPLSQTLWSTLSAQLPGTTRATGQDTLSYLVNNWSNTESFRYARGRKPRMAQVLERLAYFTSNTSAIEQRMSACQVCMPLAFARRPEYKVALGVGCRPLGAHSAAGTARAGGHSHAHFHRQGDPSHRGLFAAGV
jgi:hypothetical protein